MTDTTMTAATNQPPNNRNPWQREILRAVWILIRRGARSVLRWGPRRIWAKAPSTLNDALMQLICDLPLDTLSAFKALPREDALAGGGLLNGMALRNNWGLWHGETGVSRELEVLGLRHGDDKSSFIFTALWCKLNGEELDVDAELAFYRAHWARAGCTMDGKPLSAGDEPTPVVAPPPQSAPASRPLRRTSKRPGKRLPARKRKATRRR